MNDPDFSTDQDSPSIPIASSRMSATVFACTDTWVLGVLLFFMFTLCLTVYLTVFSTSPAPPGGLSRLILFDLGVWLVFGLTITPRFIESYQIARQGYFVLSRVINHVDFGFGKHASTRLNVSYRRGGKRHIAKASVLGKIPESGSDILVAVHPRKPHKYRVLPYDYLLSKWGRLAIIEKIKALNSESDRLF